MDLCGTIIQFPIGLTPSPAIHAGEGPFKTTRKKRRKEKQAV
jgi:hypothetical protein